MATEKKHALYLQDKDGNRIELVHADDVEDRKAQGWKEPEGMKANGEEWNREEDLPGQDLAAEFAKQKAESEAKKAQEASKKAEEQSKANEKAKADAEKSKK